MSDVLINPGKYYAKIMLFGEYSVLAGSWSVLIPYRDYGGSFAKLDSTSPESAFHSNKTLRKFARYLGRSGVNTTGIYVSLLCKDLDAGIYFKSDILQNYGLGSSASLCAALYENYALHKSGSPETLRNIFSFMESYFHGKSSGMDPLPVYFNKEVALVNHKFRLNDSLSMQPQLKLFLVDTQIQSQTAPLIQYFNEKMKDDFFKKSVYSTYVPAVNKAVEEWLSGNLSINTVLKVSALQFNLFKRMIPKSFQETWLEGLKSEIYTLKLCGSGGGGMLLGFTNDMQQTGKILQNSGKVIIPI